MEENTPQGGKETKTISKKRKSYGLHLVAVFVAILAILLVFYGSITYACLDKSLPGLKIYNQNIGFKKKNEISSQLQKINQDLQKQKITLSTDEGKTQTKFYADLGINIDTKKTTQKILEFGKIRGIFPSPAYIIALASQKHFISPIVIWEGNPQKTLGELFPEKQEAQNPSLKIENEQVQVVPEQEGFEINIGKLKNDIEHCFLTRCQTKIIASKTFKKSNISTRDLTPFLPEISNFINSKITFQAGSKKIYPKKEDLIKFVDVERTVLGQKLAYSDQAIDDYLNSIAGNVNVKAKKKKISTVDNSVISEGQEGVELKISESRNNIKKALENRQKTVSLAVGIAPVVEEYVSPGNTPGKYPGKYIEINLSEQNLYTFEGTRLLNTYKISTGKWSMPTPEGEFTINNKDPRAYSATYKLYMPYWMSFIDSKYGIHELPEWPDGTKEGEGHLGTPVSHGCVRLGRGAAQEVYDWAEIGTPVYIHK